MGDSYMMAVHLSLLLCRMKDAQIGPGQSTSSDTPYSLATRQMQWEAIFRKSYAIKDMRFRELVCLVWWLSGSSNEYLCCLWWSVCRNGRSRAPNAARVLILAARAPGYEPVSPVFEPPLTTSLAARTQNHRNCLYYDLHLYRTWLFASCHTRCGTVRNYHQNALYRILKFPNCAVHLPPHVWAMQVKTRSRSTSVIP